MNALHRAILDGDVSAVQAICRSSPSLLEERSQSGKTPLQLAEDKGDPLSVLVILASSPQNPDERRDWHALLEQCASFVSDQCAAASWLQDIEYVLWHLAMGENRLPQKWEPFDLSSLATLSSDLRFLGRMCRGWVIWSGEAPRPCSEAEWIIHYERWKEENGLAG